MVVFELSDLLKWLPTWHQAALIWFRSNAGREERWPTPLADGTLLVCKAKGIYKPAGTEYALSVRQSLNDPYPDGDPTARIDRTWSYLYFQENLDPDARDKEYTNRGLMNCLRDAVPIGVLCQVRAKPRPSYLVLGLAVVVGWEAGYFHLEGFSPEGRARSPN